MTDLITDIEYLPLPTRKLSKETCEKFGYGIATYAGKPVQVCPTINPDTRQIVSQKLRFADKTFLVIGDTKAHTQSLTGSHLWPAGMCKRLIITEGEIDALSVSQAQGNKFAVVSLPNGSASAKKAISANLPYCEAFEEVVLCFDNDEAGNLALEDVLPLFSPGKAKVAKLPLKDASDMLQAGRAQELINAMWNAQPYKPDGLFTLDDIEEDILREVAWGRPWWSETLNQWTFGRRDGEVYYFGAGTGIGKTDFFTQQITFDAIDLGVKVLVIYLEQPPSETGKRLAGKLAGKSFHVPDGTWTQDELVAAHHQLRDTGNIMLGGNFAAADWDAIKSRIRFAVHEHGIKHFYLDHLTALADTANERTSLEQITKEIALLAQELKVTGHVISHLATPDGTPHEEGGRVMMRHFKGSRAIGFWAHYAFGLERNPQDEDEEERTITTFRCLKDRFTGRANGKTMRLGYDVPTGRLFEAPPQSAEDPFANDTDDDGDAPF